MTLATWLLGAAVLLGVILAGFYLAERPIRGPTRLASLAHAALAASGTALILLAHPPDPQGFTRLALIMLALALISGALIIAAQLRRRRPSGLVVMLHATLGVAGYVMLLAAVSLG